VGEKNRMKKVVHFTDPTKIKEALENFNINSFSGKKVLFKLHMGEMGNRYYSKPDIIKPFIEELKKFEIEPFLYDTTVAYPGLRHTKLGYKKLAKMHGYQKLGYNIVIDDKGVNVKVKGRNFEVGKTLHNASNIIAFSHVKGHIATGMGGAIKNFGMGGVTKEDKKRIHQASRPIFQEDACTFCGTCAEVCTFDAIKVNERRWRFSKLKCFGCGVCVENCEYNALKNEDKNFQFLLSCAAKACVQDKNVIYINDVNRISKSCDCDPFAGPIICPDIGFLVSDDIVAIDQASLDLINDERPDVFYEKNKVDPSKQIKYGKKIGLGSMSYKKIEL
jgi:uncharacterized Fe-S center protein